MVALAPDLWLSIPHVPILDTHTLRDRVGNVLAEVTEQRLREIARNNNRRVSETGDEVPIVVGHTRDGIPEDDQPDIVGWARDFSVRRLAKTGKPVLTCLFRIDPAHADTARRFPRRSVELWFDRWEVDPISLLGATTPERDLGLLRFDRHTGRHARRIFQRENEMPDIPEPGDKGADASGKDPMVEKVLAALMQTDAWKKLESVIAKMEPAAPGVDPNASPPGAPPGLDESAQFSPGAETMPMDPSGDDVVAGVPPKKQEYAAGAPSATNTFLPGATPMKPTAPRAPAAAPYGRDASLVAKLARAEARDLQQQEALVAQAAEINELKVFNRRSTRLAVFQRLDQVEGVEFDLDQEMADVENMTDEQFAAHTQKMRSRYKKNTSRASTAVRAAMQYSRTAGAASKEPEGDDIRTIAGIAAERGISFGAAKAEWVAGGGTLGTNGTVEKVS